MASFLFCRNGIPISSNISKLSKNCSWYLHRQLLEIFLCWMQLFLTTCFFYQMHLPNYVGCCFQIFSPWFYCCAKYPLPSTWFQSFQLGNPILPVIYHLYQSSFNLTTLGSSWTYVMIFFFTWSCNMDFSNSFFCFLQQLASNFLCHNICNFFSCFPSL